MPTPTYDLIASNVLSSNASSVTFSSIPATYRDLVLISRLTTTTTSFIRINLNGSSTDFSGTSMHGDGNSTSADVWTDDKLSRHAFGDTSPNLFITQIMDYTATDKHKSILSRANRPDKAVEAVVIRYASTSAITSVTIKGDQNLQSGSTFYLYGIVS